MSRENGIAVWKVVSLLINDETLIMDWEFFYNHLGLHPSTQIQNKTSFNNGSITPFVLLNDIIRKWVSGKGARATIRVLGEVLKATRHIAIYEELLTTFPNHDAVITLSQNGNNVNSGQGQGPSQPETEPSQDQIMQYDKPELKTKIAPSGVSILELMSNREAGQGRVLIITTYLLSMLSKVGNNPVAIVSVNGRQRSGKSFLATQMVKYLKGKGADGWQDREMTANFTFSDNESSVTSGIQVWHEPLQVEHDGRTIYVILLDTQGLHDQNTGTQENAVIFGLSVLLSSVFVYNELNFADDSLQYLRSFLEFARFAAGGEQQNGVEDGGQLKFQKLVLLLRDWRASRQYKFGYYDDNTCPPGQDANLKHAKFNITPGMHENAIETREGIKRCFDNISLYAMSGPGIRYPDMPEYAHSSNWEPDFRTGVLDFAEKILSPRSIGKHVKNIFGEEVTGEGLKPYVSGWAEQIQGTDGVIQSQTIFETTAELYFSKKIDAITKEYETMMGEYISNNAKGVATEELEMFHSKTIQNLESKFTSGGAYGGEEMLKKYKAKLYEKIKPAKDQFCNTNSANIERERLRKEAEDAWNATVSQAQARLNDAKADLAVSQAKREHVVNSRQSYTKSVIHTKKHRVFGIKGIVPNSYHTSTEHDPEAYQAALSLADQEVGMKQVRVTEAEQNLQQTQSSRPKNV